MKIDELAAELAQPAYDGMTDAEAAASLNAKTVDNDRKQLSGDECFSTTSPAEWASLTDAKRNMWLAFCSKSIDPFAQANVDFVLWLFGANSQTVANLQNIRKIKISRAQELGLLDNSREVGPAHVSQARAI